MSVRTNKMFLKEDIASVLASVIQMIVSEEDLLEAQVDLTQHPDSSSIFGDCIEQRTVTVTWRVVRRQRRA